MSINTKARIRELAKMKLAVRITRRRRKTRFVIEGPDGKRVICQTKLEALENLLARLRCFEIQPWTITPEPKQEQWELPAIGLPCAQSPKTQAERVEMSFETAMLIRAMLPERGLDELTAA